MKKFLLSFSAVFVLSLGSCNPEEGTPQGLYINLSTYSLNFNNNSGQETITIETNLPKIAVTSDSKEWCTATLDGGKVVVSVSVNEELSGRTAIVKVKGEGASQTVTVTQSAIPTGAIADDVRIPVASATAEYWFKGSASDTARPVEASFDGDFQTYFMSDWGSGTTTRFPFNVDYSFKDVPSMDYFIYYPKGGTSNGYLQKLEVWYTTKENTAFTKYADLDFKGDGVSKKVEFSPALTNPTQIRLRLYEGLNSNSTTATYAGIGEIEFYRKSSDSFDYTSIFTDHSCSKLKAGVTGAQIEAIDNEFFKYLATALFNGDYDLESRVREYKVWQNPAVMAAVNKTEKYSLLDNPTGIYVETDQDLVVMASDFGNVAVSLQVIDLSTGGAGTKTTYALAKGVNKFKMTSKGLVYVMYHSDTAAEPAVKINFVTGRINGYFDKEKHTNDDWAAMLDAAVSPYFDVVGQYAHLTFPVEDFKKYTPDGWAMIDMFDKLVYGEMEFMGLVKYEKMFKNRMYFHIDTNPDASYMYATSYRTGYSIGTMAAVCGFAKPGANYWGPAHEVGHVNQTRPGLRWQGMTEVTNNIFSLHIQTSFGATSRLVTDKVYDKYVTNPVSGSIFKDGLAFALGDIWEQLVQFWQLKLYLMDVLGKTDFYKDLFEHYRTTDALDAASLTHGVYQLDFVRNVCRIANLDLTGFFEKWGMLKAVDLNVDDYVSRNFTITQTQVDDLKAEIAAAKYPKPAHDDIYMITDLNVNDYKK